MRYILFAKTKTADTFSLFKTALPTLLITTTGFAQGMTPGDLGAPIRAIDLPTITVATDKDLLSAAGTEKKSAGGFHGWRPISPTEWTEQAVHEILALHRRNALCGAWHRG